MIRLLKADGLAEHLNEAGTLCRDAFSSLIFSAGTEWLRRGVFDCWYYDPELVRVAFDGKALVGLAVADVRTRNGETFASLKLLLVRPDYRGRGIGTRMLGEIEREAAARGAGRILISDYWPLYFFGGVPSGETQALIFFHRRGYEPAGYDFHLEVPLTGNPLIDRPDPPLPDGVTICRATPDDCDRTLHAINRMFAMAWWFETSLAFRAAEPTVFIALQDKKVVGFADYDATNIGLFGPTGVHESLRGHKVGAVLFRRCLREMRALGYPYALVPTNLERLNFYYREGGAQIGRLFLRFQKKL
ncbi:MAG: GNAT family N-acetyltransferase [Candidatus Sumerlaeia bacterium]|nr:GNAT family N-acetyltransferase [Candidatus Sumerlaeia bacterium]